MCVCGMCVWYVCGLCEHLCGVRGGLMYSVRMCSVFMCVACVYGVCVCMCRMCSHVVCVCVGGQSRPSVCRYASFVLRQVLSHTFQDGSHRHIQLQCAGLVAAVSGTRNFSIAYCGSDVLMRGHLFTC